MANKLEFIQTYADVVEFMEYLYDNNCYLTVRSGTGRGALLDKTSATDAMCGDLFSAFGTYYIGQGDNREVLWMDSCGRQSHPRNHGNRGRLAGCMGCVNKNSVASIELLRQVRSYFRKNYFFKKYNGNARMSCFWGPHYTKLDEKYAAAPDQDWISAGYLRIIFEKNNMYKFEDMLSRALLRTNVITISTMCTRPYWLDNRFNEVRIEFCYNNQAFAYDSLSRLLSEIAGDASLATCRNSRNEMSASITWPLEQLIDASDKYNVSIVMEHPWRRIDSGEIERVVPERLGEEPYSMLSYRLPE